MSTQVSADNLRNRRALVRSQTGRSQENLETHARRHIEPRTALVVLEGAIELAHSGIGLCKEIHVLGIAWVALDRSLQNVDVSEDFVVRGS